MSLPDKGALAPITRERFEDHQRSCVSTCWVRQGEDPPLLTRAPLSLLDRPDAGKPELPASAEEPVLLMLAERPPKVVLNALLEAIDRGHRVYVLATQGFGEGQRDPGLRDRVKGRALVRRVPDLPASALLYGRGRAGEAWLGPSGGDEARWRLSLSPAQAHAWFQAFLQIFWHEAIDEAYTAPGGLRFQAAAARPFDVPTPGGAVQRTESGASLACPPGATVYLPGGAPPSGQPARLLFPASGEHQASLAGLVRGGAAVCWRDLGLPPFVLSADGAAMVLRGVRALHLSLHDEQRAALSAVLDSVVAAPSWRFQADIPLAELPDRPVWLADEAAASAPTRRVDLSAPSALALEIHAMDQAEPPSWPPTPTLAREARTAWQVLPPRLPKGVNEDPLIAVWRALDADVARRTRSLREALGESMNHQSRIGATFPALMGPLLGFERRRNTLLKNLDERCSVAPSASGPEQARIALQHLDRIESEAAQLSKDLVETERKAQEDAERQRQAVAHGEATREAKKQLTLRRGEQETQRDRQQELTRTVAELDAERAADKGTDKDREATRRRLGDELSAVRRRLKALDAEVPELEQRANAAFEFKPPAPPPRLGGKVSSNSFVPKASTRVQDSVPEEAPPAVGELYRQGSQRYLVVRRWEDLNQANVEGKRLAAKLVAPSEVS